LEVKINDTQNSELEMIFITHIREELSDFPQTVQMVCDRGPYPGLGCLTLKSLPAFLQLWTILRISAVVRSDVGLVLVGVPEEG
jgi:hypothetical protein